LTVTTGIFYGLRPLICQRQSMRRFRHLSNGIQRKRHLSKLQISGEDPLIFILQNKNGGQLASPAV